MSPPIYISNLIKKYVMSIMFAMTLIWGCGEQSSSRYRAHCVESLSCDTDLTASSSISSCEGDWSQQESEASKAQCGVEFEYYFDCIEMSFVCENRDQTCVTFFQEYQKCIANIL